MDGLVIKYLTRNFYVSTNETNYCIRTIDSDKEKTDVFLLLELERVFGNLYGIQEYRNLNLSILIDRWFNDNKPLVAKEIDLILSEYTIGLGRIDWLIYYENKEVCFENIVDRLVKTVQGPTITFIENLVEDWLDNKKYEYNILHNIT